MSKVYDYIRDINTESVETVLAVTTPSAEITI